MATTTVTVGRNSLLGGAPQIPPAMLGETIPLVNGPVVPATSPSTAEVRSWAHLTVFPYPAPSTTSKTNYLSLSILGSNAQSTWVVTDVAMAWRLLIDTICQVYKLALPAGYHLLGFATCLNGIALLGVFDSIAACSLAPDTWGRVRAVWNGLSQLTQGVAGLIYIPLRILGVALLCGATGVRAAADVLGIMGGSLFAICGAFILFSSAMDIYERWTFLSELEEKGDPCLLKWSDGIPDNEAKRLQRILGCKNKEELRAIITDKSKVLAAARQQLNTSIKVFAISLIMTVASVLTTVCTGGVGLLIGTILMALAGALWLLVDVPALLNACKAAGDAVKVEKVALILTTLLLVGVTIATCLLSAGAPMLIFVVLGIVLISIKLYAMYRIQHAQSPPALPSLYASINAT